MAILIPLGDPEVSARLDELKGGYYCNLDWAFTKTGLGDIMVTFQTLCFSWMHNILFNNGVVKAITMMQTRTTAK